VLRSLRSPILAAFAALVAIAAFAAAGASAGSPNSANAHLKHVFVIMEENHSLDGVIGDAAAPTFTDLAHTYGEAENYYGVTHPSLPNYIALVGGSNFGLNADDVTAHFSAPNLADQLESHGHTWASYEESMPYAGYLGATYPSQGALYASKHNPFAHFDDVLNSSARLQNIKPFSDFATDLQSNKVADFNLVVPNQCHDMHGGVYATIDPGDGSPCPYSNASGDTFDEQLKAKADAWLASTVSMIMHSKAWTGNSAIFIVADEADFDGTKLGNDQWADTSGCCDSPYLPAGDFPDNPGKPGFTWPGGVFGGGRTPAIVITTNGPRGYVSTTPYNHYSLLTTIEDNWHLGHLGNAGDTAGGVVPMNDLLTH
jgi:phosphatidylinositol-3-phosphatase